MSVGTLTRDLRGPAARTRHPARAVLSPVALVGALTAAAAMLRFAYIGRQGFWFDEANTTLLVHFSAGKMLGLIPLRESTPPLYYCLAWIWARVFGFGEVGLRSLSALAGVATVPVLYATGARLISRRAGLVLAAITATNPFLIWYSQEARSYTLLVLLSALALCAFVHARARPTPRAVGAWAAASALALATHYYATLLIVPEALWLLAIHRRERPVRFALAGIGACGLALIPLAISQNRTGHASWIGPIPLGQRLVQLPRQLLIGTGAPAATLLFAIGAGAVLLGVALLGSRAEARERGGARVAAALAAAGVALELALILGGVDDLITRNVIILWLPLALVVSAGLGARRGPLPGLAGTAALCTIGVAAALGVAADRNLERPDWRPVARAIGPRPPAGAPAGRAILIQHYRTLLPLSLYARGLKFLGSRGALVNELDVVAISSPQQNACWWGAACNLIPSDLPRSIPIPGFYVSGPVVRVNQFSLLRLRSRSPIRLTPSAVSRALTTTKLRHDGLLVQPPA